MTIRKPRRFIAERFQGGYLIVIEDSNEILEYTQEYTQNEKLTEKTTRPPKKRKRDDDNALFESALQTLQKEPDEFDLFGQYVALELRTLRSELNRAMLKSEIRKVIVRITDEELYNTISTSSTPSVSTPMPSPAFASAFSPELESSLAPRSARDYVNEFTYSDL
ncbi:hypothetical protein FQR65_LT19322 [Abscondita terminalis]|nr:hypothetical protein FQR65_LT19322 [Abscondita terminalis]